LAKKTGELLPLFRATRGICKRDVDCGIDISVNARSEEAARKRRSGHVGHQRLAHVVEFESGSQLAAKSSKKALTFSSPKFAKSADSMFGQHVAIAGLIAFLRKRQNSTVKFEEEMCLRYP
jgi:hypothetical protein